MSATYYAIPTNAGQAKITNAIALGIPLKITHMAVGDGNGKPVTPNPTQTKLVHEVRRAPLNTLFQDPLNQSQLVAEQIIPEDVGNWWIREVGLYDETSTLIAIANSPDTYKPQLSEGSGRTQNIRMVLIVSDTSAVELKIDPSVVLATRKYVDDVMAAHKQSRDHPDASETAKGFTRYATQPQTDAGAADDVAVTPKKLKAALKAAGLTEYGSALIGVPIDWPLAQMPQDIWPDCGMIFLSCAGQGFNKATYPKLGQCYPSGVMPELRAEFIRGWDNGRGVDTGRGLLSAQSGVLEAHTHEVHTAINTDSDMNLLGGLNDDPIAVKSQTPTTVYKLTSARVKQEGGSETRPRNLAFHKIMRAE